jgi:hypothetical protein
MVVEQLANGSRGEHLQSIMSVNERWELGGEKAKHRRQIVAIEVLAVNSRAVGQPRTLDETLTLVPPHKERGESKRGPLDKITTQKSELVLQGNMRTMLVGRGGRRRRRKPSGREIRTGSRGDGTEGDKTGALLPASNVLTKSRRQSAGLLGCARKEIKTVSRDKDGGGHRANVSQDLTRARMRQHEEVKRRERRPGVVGAHGFEGRVSIDVEITVRSDGELNNTRNQTAHLMKRTLIHLQAKITVGVGELEISKSNLTDMLFKGL